MTGPVTPQQVTVPVRRRKKRRNLERRTEEDDDGAVDVNTGEREFVTCRALWKSRLDALK